jgi:hypothetical protein
VVAATDDLRLEEGLIMEPTVPTGVIENVAVLDLLGMRTADELAAIARIQNVAVVLVPESLTGALARIPTRNIASIVPVPDGAEVRVHTGAVVLGGDALADPSLEDLVLVVTGTLALSSPVERIAYRRVIVTGTVLAPYGSEAALGAGLSRVTGSVHYYDHVEGQRFRALSGQTELSGEMLANTGGNPADVLFLTGQTTVTGPVTEVGYQHVFSAGQLLAPRDSQAVLAPVLTSEGQVVWYDGHPRIFSGADTFGRGFFELVDEPMALLLLGQFTFEDDLPPALLREKVTAITLIGKIVAPPELVPLLQLLTTQKHGRITTQQDDGDDHG